MINKKIYLTIAVFMTAFSLYPFDAAVAMANEETLTVQETTLPPEDGTAEVLPPESDTTEILPSEDGITEALPPENDTAEALPPENDTTEPILYEDDVSETLPSETAVFALQLPESDVVEKTDFVSNGKEFINWLESHKSSGGSVKLVNNIVLDEDYEFIPYWVNMPPILVDTGSYNITVNALVSFTGVNALSFQGGESAHTIFHVSAGGVLYLSDVSLQGTNPQAAPQYMLWQEEGAALIINNCQIAGDIHYADMPVVMESSPACVIVESGQGVSGALPAEIECEVNYQGSIQRHKMMPVVWNLAGTEQWQEGRVRFHVQGSYPDAAFLEAPICTVAYHDYPLTFLNVRGSASRGFYSFRGGYTKPEEYLPITLVSEYSFDEKNWIIKDESIVSDPLGDFYIAFKYEEWDTTQYPYVHIRLRFHHDGVDYYSNVLRFAADNLDVAEDRGGNRGGGTSIVNPPDAPQEEQNPSGSSLDDTVGTEPSENIENAAENAAPDNAERKPDEASESVLKTESEAEVPSAAQAETISPTEVSPVTEKTIEAAEVSQDAEPAVNIEAEPDTESASDEVSDSIGESSVFHYANADKTSGKAETLQAQELTAPQGEKQNGWAAMVIGFITLSAAAGVIGFIVQSGTNK